MSQFLVLSHLRIQNANSIAGLTWGFPAITQFLGFVHALSRKMSRDVHGEYDTTFSGCAVVAHFVQNRVYRPQQGASFEFIQSKNPPVFAKNKKGSPPIIEEGKVHLDVSLIVELDKPLALNSAQVSVFEEEVRELCLRLPVAGGTTLDVGSVKLLSASTDQQKVAMLRKVKKLCLPGFVLMDRRNYLESHYQTLRQQEGVDDVELLSAWLDFSALKYKAEPVLEDSELAIDENTKATWLYQAKPRNGYLVPIMAGYKAISELYEAGEVLDVRDTSVQSRFVESVHTIGEWVSMHRIDDLPNAIWRYQQDGNWYLCQQTIQSLELDLLESDQAEDLTLNDLMNEF